MSAIGSFLGLNGGQGGTGFSTIQGATPEQMNQAYNQVTSQQGQIQNLVNALQAQGGIQNQQQVYNQLQQVAQGQGFNPAQAQLAQATGANVANQAALMAGQRGANANVGLMARQAAQQGAQTQQQAAGQAATLQAQQALGAMGQAGQMAQAQTGQQMQAQQLAAQTALQNQAALQQANAAYSQQQVEMAKGEGAKGQALFGGLMQAGAAAAGVPVMPKAHGGEIENFYEGGESAQPDMSHLHGPMGSPPPAATAPEAKKPSALGSFMSSQGQKLTQTAGVGMTSAPQYAQIQTPMDLTAIAPISRAQGGSVGNQLRAGGKVPGRAKIAGDHLKNDTVHAMLSPGEVVIPRSVMNSSNPADGAKKFVAALQAKKGR